MNETRRQLFFEELAERGIAMSDDLAPAGLWRPLSRLTEDVVDFSPARVGGPAREERRAEIRGDRIAWLETHDPRPEVAAVWAWLEEWRRDLNRFFFSGLTHVESHLAVYPAGAGYDWHFDRPQGHDHRHWTFLLYLNENWPAESGGELEFEWPAESRGTDVGSQARAPGLWEPLGGRWVIFRSDQFRHRVRPAQQPRKSLTGWFRDDPAF